MALTAGGNASSDRAKHGKFRLKSPADEVTLHLRAKDGTYAGPIVVDREGKRAILGVEAGADLGRISVRWGYAKVNHPLPRSRSTRAGGPGRGRGFLSGPGCSGG